MKPFNFNTLLVLIVVMLSTGLLISQQFSTPQLKAVLIGPGLQEWSRGETITSFDRETPMKIIFGSVTEIWLDTRTEIKLVDGREGHLTIDVLQGRIIATGPLTISTREVKTHIDSPTSFVHYSWLNKIEVAVINDEAYEQSTLPPYNKNSFTFDPIGSIANEFYTEVISKIQTPGTSAE